MEHKENLGHSRNIIRHLQQSKFLRNAAVIGTGIGIVGGVIPETPAMADSGNIHQVYRTGNGLYLHPDSPTLQSKLSDLMPDGTPFKVTCRRLGSVVNGNGIWLFGTNQKTGHMGYAADYYIDTKWRSLLDLTSQGIPPCEANSEPSPKVENRNEDVGYKRNQAVDWALQHANDMPPFDGACTWFVSNALWQGGLQKTDDWTDSGSHGHPKTPIGGNGVRPGTNAATAVPDFQKYLLKTYPKSSWRQLSPNQNPVPDALPGDLIFYDWGETGNNGKPLGITHATIITNIAPGQYPEVSEWSPRGGQEQAGYTKRGWTWSEVNREWLQKKYGSKLRIYLLHIDTGVRIAPDGSNLA